MTNLRFKLFLLFIMFLQFGGIAQKDVVFRIQHMVGTEPFGFEKEFKNDLGHKVMIKRLDYYVSNIILYHDGIESIIEDPYMLVKGGIAEKFLGNINISKLDSINISIGVDYKNNHADPTTFPADHPLAPKDPEMHWGWAAGYRFAAIEGKSGDNLEYNYQIHSLDDVLFYKTVVPNNGFVSDGKLYISLDVDCTKLFSGINMKKNIFKHGSTGEAKTLMQNFNKKVIAASSQISSSKDNEEFIAQVYPAMSDDGIYYIETNSIIDASHFEIYDINGRRLLSKKINSNFEKFTLNTGGVYFVKIFGQNKRLIKKVVRL